MRQDGAGHDRAQNERVAILAEGLIAQKPDQLAGLLEQYQSTNQSMAEAHRTAVTEMGSAVRAGIERLADVNAQAQREMAAHQQALRVEIEKLVGTIEALSARLVPGLRRLSVVDQRVGAALDRHDSTASRGQALMEELAGLLEGVRSSLERVVDAAASAGHRSSAAPTPPPARVSAGPDTPSLRDELEALRSELEAAQRDVSLDPVAPNQPPS
jgi:chromosome segregation ATPase